MKIRNGFVSNSSSASFIVGFPIKERSEALLMLFNLFEHDLFGKYYLKEELDKRLSSYEESLNISLKKLNELKETPVEKRLTGINNSFDRLSWAESDYSRWLSICEDYREKKQDLENIKGSDAEALTEFGLKFYGVSLFKTLSDDKKENSENKITLSDDDNLKGIVMSQWDPDATDDRDITFTTEETLSEVNTSEVVGHELCSTVSMYNSFSDIPNILKTLTGALAFTFGKDLKCWVDDCE